MKGKKRLFFVSEDNYQRMLKILEREGIVVKDEYQVFGIHLLSVVITSIVWIAIIIAIAAMAG